jgi:hypothetical protein
VNTWVLEELTCDHLVKTGVSPNKTTANVTNATK